MNIHIHLHDAEEGRATARAVAAGVMRALPDVKTLEVVKGRGYWYAYGEFKNGRPITTGSYPSLRLGPSLDGAIRYFIALVKSERREPEEPEVQEMKKVKTFRMGPGGKMSHDAPDTTLWTGREWGREYARNGKTEAELVEYLRKIRLGPADINLAKTSFAKWKANFRTKDSPNNPTGYAKSMAEAAEREKEKAIKRLATYTATFGSNDPLTKAQEEEVKKHRENAVLWRRHAAMNGQALAKVLRSGSVPTSAFGYGVQYADAKDPLLARGAEYEGRLFFGAYSYQRLIRLAHPKAPIRGIIEEGRKNYNTLRRQVGLPEVTDWTKRPEQTMEQMLREQMKGRDAKWTGEYSAQVGKVRKQVTKTVTAPDHYEATDRLREAFIKTFGQNYFNPVVRWQTKPESNLSKQSLRIAQKAGPEEDSAPKEPIPKKENYAEVGDTVHTHGGSMKGVVQRIVKTSSLPYALVKWENGSTGRHTLGTLVKG